MNKKSPFFYFPASFILFFFTVFGFSQNDMIDRIDFDLVKGNLKPAENPVSIGKDIFLTPMQKEEFILLSKIIPDKFRIEIITSGKIKPGYKYPVIYVTDGHYRETDYKYIQYLAWKKIIPPVVVVGIGYPGGYDYDKIRVRDLIDHPETFKRLIDEEVVPRIESLYSCDPSKRILFGASSGGYFVLKSLLSDVMNNTNLYYAYLAATPSFNENSFQQAMEQIAHLTNSDLRLNTRLYVTAGQKEYARNVNKIWGLVNSINPVTNRGLTFYNYFYPETDHYEVTRLSLVDGLKLFLSKDAYRRIGFKDINYQSMFYKFSQNAELLDWSFLNSLNNSALTNLSLTKEGNGYYTKADCCFIGNLKDAVMNVTFDHFENMNDKKIGLKIFVPDDLAKLKYTFFVGILSTYNWVFDMSQPLVLDKSGWQSYTFDIKDIVKKGKVELIRKVEIHLFHPDQSGEWSGSFGIDDVYWE
jgi:predicted alpha/beta superfamily hydrolase